MERRAAEAESKRGRAATVEAERDALREELEAAWAHLGSLNRDLAERENEFSRERDELVDRLSDLRSQLALRECIVAAFVPPNEEAKVIRRAQWDSDDDEWVLGAEAVDGPGGAAGRPGSRAGERPSSARGAGKRPVSAFARAQAAAGDGNPRFRGKDILRLELDMPEGTTYALDEAGVDDPAVREALGAAFLEDEGGWAA